MELLWPVSDQEIRERALRWEAENRGRRAAERAQRLRGFRRALSDIFAHNPDLPRTFLRYLAWLWCVDLLTLETMYETILEERAQHRARRRAYWLPSEDRILWAHGHDLPYAVQLLNRYALNNRRGVQRSLPAARRRLRLLRRARKLGFGPMYV